MSNLRNLIDQPMRVYEEVLEDKGIKYLFRGSPDANQMADTLLLQPHKAEQYANLWTQVCETYVDVSLVKHIKAVHKTLVAADWDSKKKEWVLLDPYDETEIARLACKEGPLFLKMISKAFTCLGLTEEQQKSMSAFDGVGSGNLEEQVDTN